MRFGFLSLQTVHEPCYYDYLFRLEQCTILAVFNISQTAKVTRSLPTKAHFQHIIGYGSYTLHITYLNIIIMRKIDYICTLVSRSTYTQSYHIYVCTLIYVYA